jgi:hypothetical protein
MVYSNPQSVKDKATEKTLSLIEERDHIFVKGKYENRESKLTVFCPNHQKIHETTFYNYYRSRHGTPCCGDEAKSKKLKDREYSQETLAKMKKAASGRPFRGGKPRRWRETHAYRSWRAKVLKAFNNTCAITGLKGDTHQLAVHHLINAHLSLFLVYEPLNGVVILKELHELFHNTYGYKHNSVDQFIEFCEKCFKNGTLSTPISSQASWEQEEGSETRVYDPVRIMELQERLKKIQPVLIAKAEEKEANYNKPYTNNIHRRSDVCYSHVNLARVYSFFEFL